MKDSQPMPEWVRIVKMDNWGRVFYTCEDALGPELPLEDGMELRLMWADGTVRGARLASRPHTSRYTEQGSPSPTEVETRVFGVWEKIRGRRTWFSLEQFRVLRRDFSKGPSEADPQPLGDDGPYRGTPEGTVAPSTPCVCCRSPSPQVHRVAILSAPENEVLFAQDGLCVACFSAIRGAVRMAATDAYFRLTEDGG